MLFVSPLSNNIVISWDSVTIALRFVICVMQGIFTRLDCRLSEFTKAFSFFSVVDVQAPKYLLKRSISWIAGNHSECMLIVTLFIQSALFTLSWCQFCSEARARNCDLLVMPHCTYCCLINYFILLGIKLLFVNK